MIKNWLRERKAYSLFIHGTQQSTRGEYEQAINNLTRAIEVNPKLLDAYIHRGIAYMESGNSDAAIADQSFVIQRKPQDALAYCNRGIAYFLQGEINKALADLKEAARLDPTLSTAYSYIGHVLVVRKEYVPALAAFTKTIELGDPEDGFFNRAATHERLKDYPAAIVDWGNLIKAFPKSAQAYCRRGLAYIKLRRNELAIADLERGLKHKNQLKKKLADDAVAELERLKKK